MQEPSALGRIVELVRDLRKRCPWDAAQTPQSLRPYFVEEAMELDHAIGTADRDELREELGDVLLHVAFQIVLAEERGEFGADDLTTAVERKMWRRHPHLFDEDGTPVDESVDTAQVRRRWEATKRQEKPPADPSVLNGIPPTLPPLLAAFRLQERAAGVGFDWPDATGPLAKVREEVDELDQEIASRDAEAIADEIGDLLFAVVNLARKLECDPRAALERANDKFARRFRQVEVLADERGIDLHTAGLDALDRIWDEIKDSQGVRDVQGETDPNDGS
jgi:MazG family protein